MDNIYIYIDEEEFRYIFHNIPTVSMDYLRQYLFKVLNFFKSYKVDFTRVNVVYTMLSIGANAGNSVSSINLILDVHESETLKAKVEDGNFEEISDALVTWSSSNTSVASVDSTR